MVLLTSSQVQVALSSAIICSFTFFLFLAGYIIQQRSVEGLHVALRPKAPTPRHKSPEQELPLPSDPSVRFNRPFGRLRDRLHWQNQLVAADAPFDWSALAYAQLVRDHSEVCNALILFSDLHRLRSAAPRLLLFPQHWIEERDGEVLDPFLETSRRLLKKASRRYRVTLVPIKPDVAGRKENEPEAYSMAALSSTLYQYKKVMTFPPPGLILDTTPLDSILAFAEIDGIAAYPALNASDASTIVVVPSDSSAELLTQQALSSLSSDTLLPDPQDHTLFTTSHALRVTEPNSFNATDFIASTAYIHFSDPDLPGPEYDIPYSSIVKMRPTGEDQSFLWEKMYSTFKDRRYGVCGLDLEVWPPIPKPNPAAAKQADRPATEGRTDL